MVDFTLTDEQRALREMAHDFAVKEIRPVAWEYDKEGTWPAEVLDKAFDRTFARVAKDGVSERTAAMAIGVERVRDAKATRGLFP